MILESQDAHVEKSSHFMVCLDGSVVQCVGTQNAAYGNNIVDKSPFAASPRVRGMHRSTT